MNNILLLFFNMKKILSYIITLLCFANVYSQTFSESLKFQERSFDFGKIKEKDGLVSHEFTFQNVDKKPIAISGMSSGCGCVKFEYPKYPIKPGASDKVKVYFNPAYRPGFFSKEVVVMTNDNKNYTRIWVKGTVEPYEHPVSERYPYEYGEGLWMNFEIMAFGYMNEGDKKKMDLKFANDTDKEMKLFFIIIDGNTDVTFTSPYTMKPKEEKTMQVTYSYSGKFPRVTNVYPVVNGKTLDKPLKVMCSKP